MPPAAASRAVTAAPNSDRRQSTRQGRTSVTRPTNYYARPFPGRMAHMGGLEQTPPATNTSPGFLPALTHFTNAADAFPKEMINHFSMFKEVEAKIHDPEHVLQILLDEIAKQPVPTLVERQKAAQATRDASINGSVNGSVHDGPNRLQQISEDLFPTDLTDRPPEEQAQLRKRQLFFRLRMVIGSMLPTLDEKLVVLTSAKAMKDKCLARMNSSYTHVDEEISEEARYGSLNHWAYADKEEKKKGGTSNERHRREVASANNLAAAAQQVHDADSIAAKSEARREAMLAKRHKNQHVDSDFDDSRPVKKTQKRKAAADNAAQGAIGLGISNGTAQQGKRKKTEKALAAAAAAPPMERSLSGALQSAAAGGRNGGSPRSTPAAENGPKRKPRAPGPGPGRKRAPNAIGAQSPLLVSSPLATAFPVSVVAAAQRPQSVRARKNSTANSVISAAPEPAAPRPSSSQSTRPIHSSAIAELQQAAAGVVRDNIPAKDVSTPKEPVENILPPFASSNLKHEEPEPPEPEAMEVDRRSPAAPVTTRAARASKTATPIVGTFPEIPMARSRSTRNTNNGNGGATSQTSSENNSTTAPAKRTHKKTASTHTAILPSPAPKPTPPTKSAPSTTTSSPPPDPEFSDAIDEDGDEPRYCYCNEVSYGNMIACDNIDCPREWFHLACVNMEKAPNARTKWFCSDECREAHAKASKPKAGRPGSSRQ